jgi:hypothetical protein
VSAVGGFLWGAVNAYAHDESFGIVPISKNPSRAEYEGRRIGHTYAFVQGVYEFIFGALGAATGVTVDTVAVGATVGTGGVATPATAPVIVIATGVVGVGGAIAVHGGISTVLAVRGLHDPAPSEPNKGKGGSRTQGRKRNCKSCGAPHGGLFGPYCPPCWKKRCKDEGLVDPEHLGGD